MSEPIVGVVMGSDSDLKVMQKCLDTLKDFGIAYEVRIISAHRTPQEAHEYATSAVGRGLKIIIAAAGMSAALSGVLAAATTLPVIGVPIASGELGGIDAFVSIAQMPPGVPVGCMAIDGAYNAAVYAATILGLDDSAMAQKLVDFKQQMAKKVIAKDQALQK